MVLAQQSLGEFLRREGLQVFQLFADANEINRHASALLAGTLSSPKGNGGQNGDQFRIRGLSAKGDIYVDGLRDFGAYKRDAFNTESVEVIKGPSGEPAPAEAAPPAPNKGDTAWMLVATSMVVLMTIPGLALFYGGLQLLARSPVWAGILLGLLSYKPQIWVLVPLALLAARQWRALASMAATVLVLMLASAASFGPAFWLAFLDAAREAAGPRVVEEMFERIFMHMTTLLAAARIVGLPPAVSGLVQAAGALLAMVAVWLSFSRKGQSDARIAVLATATFLVSPYTLNYDLLLLMPAAVAMFRLGIADGFRPMERLVLLMLWLIPTLGMILNRLDLPLMPLVILAFGWFAWQRLGALKPA